MKLGRKITIFLIAVGLFAFFGFAFLIKKSPEKPPAPAPTPVVPTQTKGEYEVEVLFSESDFDFSQKATVDTKKSSPFSEEEVARVASALSLTEGPIAANDATEGKVVIYRNESAGLVAYLQKGKIVYALNELPKNVGRGPAEEEIVALAKSFLVENGFTESPGIEFSSFLFLKTEGTRTSLAADKEEAAIYQVNFVPAGSSRPLLASDARGAPIYVQVLPSGTVFASSFQKMSVVKGSTEYNLKNYQDVLSGIASSVLVSLNDGNVHLPDLPENAVKKVSLDKISLVSLFDPEKNSLLPVFLLEGTAEVSGLGSKIKAALYLPSLKGP